MKLTKWQGQANPLSVRTVREERYWDEDGDAPRTPWGRAQTLTQYDGDRLGEVTTAGHGGFYVRGEWARKIPHYLRKTWYEEDCEIKIVAYYLFDELKALQEAYKAQGVPYPYAGIIGAFETRDKAHFEKGMLTWHRPLIDFKTGKQSVRSDFETDEDFAYYQQEMVRLAEKANKKKTANKIAAGDIVEFTEPLSFSANGGSVQVKRFEAIAWGKRAIRFKPLDVAADFIARISHINRRDFTICS